MLTRCSKASVMDSCVSTAQPYIKKQKGIICLSKPLIHPLCILRHLWFTVQPLKPILARYVLGTPIKKTYSAEGNRCETAPPNLCSHFFSCNHGYLVARKLSPWRDHPAQPV